MGGLCVGAGGTGDGPKEGREMAAGGGCCGASPSRRLGGTTLIPGQSLSLGTRCSSLRSPSGSFLYP